jgi:hypothetical protein
MTTRYALRGSIMRKSIISLTCCVNGSTSRP